MQPMARMPRSARHRAAARSLQHPRQSPACGGAAYPALPCGQTPMTADQATGSCLGRNREQKRNGAGEFVRGAHPQCDVMPPTPRAPPGSRSRRSGNCWSNRRPRPLRPERVGCDWQPRHRRGRRNSSRIGCAGLLGRLRRMLAMERAGCIGPESRQQQECDRNAELLHVSPLPSKESTELICFYLGPPVICITESARSGGSSPSRPPSQRCRANRWFGSKPAVPASNPCRERNSPAARTASARPNSPPRSRARPGHLRGSPATAS